MSNKANLYILTDAPGDSDNEDDCNCDCEPEYYINGKAAYLEMLRHELCGTSASIAHLSQEGDDTKPLVGQWNKAEIDIDKLIAVLSEKLSLKDLKRCTRECR